MKGAYIYCVREGGGTVCEILILYTFILYLCYVITYYDDDCSLHHSLHIYTISDDEYNIYTTTYV
jgi:hypothetical protein